MCEYDDILYAQDRFNCRIDHLSSLQNSPALRKSRTPRKLPPWFAPLVAVRQTIRHPQLGHFGAMLFSLFSIGRAVSFDLPGSRNGARSVLGLTLDIYGHLYTDMQDWAAVVMDEVMTPIRIELPVKNGGKC